MDVGGRVGMVLGEKLEISVGILERCKLGCDVGFGVGTDDDAGVGLVVGNELEVIVG